MRPGMAFPAWNTGKDAARFCLVSGRRVFVISRHQELERSMNDDTLNRRDKSALLLAIKGRMARSEFLFRPHQ